MFDLFANGTYYLGNGFDEVIVKSPLKDALALLFSVMLIGLFIGCIMLFVVFDVPSIIRKWLG